MIAERILGNLFGSKIGSELDALAQAYTAHGKFAGAALVARKGEILLKKGYGLANREHNVPNTPQTVFRIGSMSKPFTAIAIMQLVEAGQLSLDDTVSKFLPDFPNGERITVHHLLSNRSGIRDYILMPEYQTIKKQRVTTEQVIALFRNEPLLFEPGTQFSYSNGNWVLLGYILEKLTSKSYEAAIRERIFDPVGMRNSGAEWEKPLIQHRANGYDDTGAGYANAELHDDTTMHGAGALYSTVEDLYKWDRALYGETLLKQATLQQMFAPISESYGYGWELHTLHGRRAIGHSGGMPGYASNIARFIDDDVTVIVASNVGGSAVLQLTEGLSAVVFGAPYETPSARPFVSVDPAILADYVGNYSVTFYGRTSIMEFTLENDHLVLAIRGLPTSIVSAYSDTTFYARPKGDVEMTFVRDASGQVNTIEMDWSGHKLTATRVNA
ncbi:MAG TPA: serine hydrolase [Oceanobacillus sp.]|nr:serine hydrolase [Oceanobacillus sp.]